MASEVSYYTYMYAKVSRDKYQKVTGHARSAILSGRFLASVIAQVLISFDIMDFRDLNYLSLGGN
jgi:thiamine transporter 2/3